MYAMDKLSSIIAACPILLITNMSIIKVFNFFVALFYLSRYMSRSKQQLVVKWLIAQFLISLYIIYIHINKLFFIFERNVYKLMISKESNSNM